MSVVFPVTADPRFRLSTAIGGETAFSVPFPFQDKADIAVIRYASADDLIGAELIEGMHYTLSGISIVGGKGFSGGSIALVAAALPGERYLRLGRTIIDRVTSIIRGGSFSSQAIDNDLDRWILIAQELSRESGRSWKAGLGQTGGQIAIGDPGSTLKFDENGNLIQGPDAATIESVEENADRAEAARERAEQLSELVAQSFDGLSPILRYYAVGDAVQSVNLGLPAPKGFVRVIIDGAYQFSNTWDVNDGILTPVGAPWPGNGVRINMEVVIAPEAAIAFGVPVDGTITPAKMHPNGDFNGLRASIWDSGATRTMRQRGRDTYCLLDAPGQPDPSGNNDSTVAIRSMLAEGIRCEVPDGVFVWDFAIDPRGMVNNKISQILFGHGAGWGRVVSENMGEEFQPRSAIKFVGTAAKIIRTRRQPRLNAGAAQDSPISAMLHVGADNFMHRDIAYMLDVDYSNASPSNLGADADTGIFLACRTGYQESNVAVYGYQRVAGRYFDVTGLSNNLGLGNDSPILGPAGYTFPDMVSRGIDGVTMFDPIGVGSRKSLFIAGRIPTGTSQYYDQAAGLISDQRGSFGGSDFKCIGGALFNTHHSGQRWQEPRGDLNHLLEPETSPANVHIDAASSNAATVIQNMSFHRTRFSGQEIFHVRLGRCNRVTFDNPHFDYEGSSADNYGSITADGADKTMNITVYNTPSSPRDANFHQHVAGYNIIAPTSGLTNLQRLVLQDRLESVVGEMEVRSLAGSGGRMRSGTNTILQIDAGGVYDNTTATGANVYVTSNNQLQRFTSSGRYKTDIEDLEPAYRDLLLELTPVWYRSLCPSDNPEWSWYGLIAEQVAEIDPRLVQWRTTETRLVDTGEIDDDGNPVLGEVVENLPEPVADGVMYDRLVVHLIAWAKDTAGRLAQIEGRLSALEGSSNGH